MLRSIPWQLLDGLSEGLGSRAGGRGLLSEASGGPRSHGVGGGAVPGEGAPEDVLHVPLRALSGASQAEECAAAAVVQARGLRGRALKAWHGLTVIWHARTSKPRLSGDLCPSEFVTRRRCDARKPAPRAVKEREV